MESEMAKTRRCPICFEDNPEWVAYGACGHGEICSTCVARLRFIRQRFRCYYCNRVVDFVFVTKASSDLERNINFPPKPKEGQQGEIWYHADTKAFFDDFGEYQRIKTMCRISCNSCGETKFSCVGELMSHLLEKHKVYMCLICVAFHELFVCEQKLFTTEQLNQHIRTGDSEVDGTDVERGGFTGHPHCEQCRNPFYGDEKIYVHFSTISLFYPRQSSISCDCHICRRIYPVLSRNEYEMQDHFVETHIQDEDGYWNANFPIIRAFYDDEDLLEHNYDEHFQFPRQEDNDDVHDQSTIQVPSPVHNRDESFRLEPVYAYTHSPAVPPFYCPPPLMPVQSQQHARFGFPYSDVSSSGLPPLPAQLQPYGDQRQFSNQYRGIAQHQQPYGDQRQYSNQYRGYAQQQQPYGGQTQFSNQYRSIAQQQQQPYGDQRHFYNQYRGYALQQQPYGDQRQYSYQYRGHAQQGRVEMARTHLGLGSSSLNTTTQSPLAQSRFLSSSFHPFFVQQSRTRPNSDLSFSSRADLGQPQVPSSSYPPFSVQQQSYQDQSRTRLNSDVVSSSRAYLGQPQEARFGMSGTHQSYSAPDTRTSYLDYVEGLGFSGLVSEMARPSSNPPPFSGQQPYQGHSSAQSSNPAPLAHGRSFSESYGLSSSANARFNSSQAQSSDPPPLSGQQPYRDQDHSSSAQSSDRAPLPPKQDFLGHLESYGLSDLAPRFWNDSEIQQFMDTSNAILNTSQAPVMVESKSDDSEEDQDITDPRPKRRRPRHY